MFLRRFAMFPHERKPDPAVGRGLKPTAVSLPFRADSQDERLPRREFQGAYRRVCRPWCIYYQSPDETCEIQSLLGGSWKEIRVLAPVTEKGVRLAIGRLPSSKIWNV